MTSQRCLWCAKEGIKGRLRPKPNQDPKGQTIYKCKKCGREYIKVRHRWVRTTSI